MKNGEYELVIAPENYPGKTYRNRRYVYEHHLVYWLNTGHVVQDGEEIHHKNKNKRDNRFDNLELQTSFNHKSIHGKEKERIMVKLKCPYCEKIFERRRGSTHLVGKKYTCTFTSCSRYCVGKFTDLKRKDPELYNKRIEENIIQIVQITGV